MDDQIRGSAVSWRKSTYSGGNNGQCVEIADLAGRVLVRDSKRPDQGHLTVGRDTWAAFTEAVQAGQFI